MVASEASHPSWLEQVGYYTTDPEAVNGATEKYVELGGIRVAPNMLDNEMNLEIAKPPTAGQMKQLENLNAETPVYWDLHKGSKLISGSGTKEQFLKAVNKTYNTKIGELPKTPPKVIIPKLPKSLLKDFQDTGARIAEDMADPATHSKMNDMLNYLEQYRNISNAPDEAVQLQLRWTKNLAEKIIKEDDLFKRGDTKAAQAIFNKTVDRINTALDTGNRSDAVIAIDSFVNSVHQDFPLSLLPRAFDIADPLEVDSVLSDYLEFAAGGNFRDTGVYKNIMQMESASDVVGGPLSQRGILEDIRKLQKKQP